MTRKAAWEYAVGVLVALMVLPLVWGVSKMMHGGQWPDSRGPERVVYPQAPAMPAAVKETMPEVLERLEKVVKEKSPEVWGRLRPGLSDEEINALEKRYGVKLDGEMRALYRWHDGADDGKQMLKDLSCYHHFLPLGEGLAMREKMAQGIRNERRSTIAYRMTWLYVFEDYCGDGYWYDPAREMGKGAFFFSFTETGDYEFYPSVRNFIAYLAECWEVGVGVNPPVAKEDYAKVREIQRKYGVEVSTISGESG